MFVKVEELQEAVQAEADSRQDEILDFVAMLWTGQSSNRYILPGDLVVANSNCSYERYLPAYITAKRRVAILDKKLGQGWYDSVERVNPADLRRQWSTAIEAVRRLQDLLYTDACGWCASCRGRRRKWPTRVVS